MIYKLGTVAFAGLLTYTILRRIKIRRDTDAIIFRLQQEADDPDIPEDEVPWGWIMDMDGEGQPLNVPADLIAEAIEILDAETEEERDAMNEGQWSWHLDAMAIREVLSLGQAMPDLEQAFFTWVANNSGIPGREES